MFTAWHLAIEAYFLNQHLSAYHSYPERRNTEQSKWRGNCCQATSVIEILRQRKMSLFDRVWRTDDSCRIKTVT